MIGVPWRIYEGRGKLLAKRYYNWIIEQRGIENMFSNSMVES